VSNTKPFGLWSGVGLVIANMIGAGVFLSTGYMAQTMPPGRILLAWGVGLVLAMAGARAYAEVARLVPRGGGEYRYLTVLLHPAMGYVAGWGSLLLGFSAPIAVDALAAGAFAHAVQPQIEPRWFAAALVVGLTAIHAIGLRTSSRVQNGLVVLKVLLLLGFVGVAVVSGTLALPTWVPPSTASATPLADFVGSLFYVAFAYSGWNAAIYASDEFANPARDVPRAMLIGCLAVGTLYLLVNYLFVANLTPEQASVVRGYGDFTSLKGEFNQVTLGQAVMAQLLGSGAAKVMSAVMILLFVSAMSAMTLVGPRVYAAMARDGFLPRVLAGAEGHPPTGAVLLQGGLALVVLWTHELRSMLTNMGAILVLFAAMTVSGLFRAAWRAERREDRPAPASLVAAGVYVLSSAVMLYFGFRESMSLLLWVGGVFGLALIGWLLMKKHRAGAGASDGGTA
jgi:APA family basic amino acid/polyamine antiporter